MVVVQPLCAAAGTRLGEVREVVPLGKRAEAQEWCIGAMGELKARGEDDMVR
jgi:hypothetical protein